MLYILQRPSFKILVISILILLNHYTTYCQTQSIVGVFRSIEKPAITYIEFKTDSTVTLKRVLLDSIDEKGAVNQIGIWTVIKDTVTLIFTNQGSNRSSALPQLTFLIKNKNVLYTSRLKNGRFVTDTFFRKAKGRLNRLPKELQEEYARLK